MDRIIQGLLTVVIPDQDQWVVVQGVAIKFLDLNRKAN
jgi:hypothetical protein